MSEEVFFRALRDAAKQWPSALEDYTAAVSQYGPRREEDLSLGYILFIELEGEPLTEAQTDLVRRGRTSHHKRAIRRMVASVNFIFNCICI